MSVPRFFRRLLRATVVVVPFFSALAEPIQSKTVQGSSHIYLELLSSDGKVIAFGEMTQVAHGRHFRSRLLYRFRDGSIDDEVTEYEQTTVYRVLSDHHVQKGPSFPKPLDFAFDVAQSQTTSREMKDGKEEVKVEHVDFPDDLANGIVPLVAADMDAGATELKVSYVAGTPKPRIVKLSIKPVGVDSFRVAGLTRRARKFNVHVEIGGLTGVIAPIIGKQPDDIQVWIALGEVQSVIKSEGAFYTGGPAWRTEQAKAVWSKTAEKSK